MSFLLLLLFLLAKYLAWFYIIIDTKYFLITKGTSFVSIITGAHMAIPLSHVYCKVIFYHVSKKLYQGLLLTCKFSIVNS